MAVYTKSQLSELNELKPEKLGIIARANSSSMRPDARILVVGLGGVGFETVVALKQQLTDRIGKLDPTRIRFLSIDTDKQTGNKAVDAGILTTDEVCFAHNPQLQLLASMSPDLIPTHIKKLLPPNGSVPLLKGEGAGQIRLAGRISMLNQQAYDDLKSKITLAISGMGMYVTEKLIVHVISGIGGGTGSGMTIDVPYLIRKVFVQDMNLSATKLQVYGHVCLPDVYSAQANYQDCKVNAYAALKEIDHFMNIDTLGETYTAEFANGTVISSNKPIFDQCTLVGGHPDADIVVDRPREFAVKSSVEDMINLITSVITEKDDTGKSDYASDFFNSSSFLDNIHRATSYVLQKNPGWPKNAFYQYCCVGASRLKFPNIPIAENVIGHVWGKMAEKFDLNAKNITQKDVDEIEKKIGIKPDRLIAAAIETVEQEIADQIDNEKFNKDEVSKDMVALRQKLKTIAENAPSKLKNEQELCKDAVSRANAQCEDIFGNGAKGPFVLERILTSDPTNVSTGAGLVGLYSKFNGYYDTLISISAAEDDIQNSHAKTKSVMIDEVRKASIFTVGRKIEEYKEELKKYYISMAKKAVADRLAQSYFKRIEECAGIAYQLKNALDGAFLSYAQTLHYVGEEIMVPCTSRARYDDTDPESVFSLKGDEFKSLQTTVSMFVDKTISSFTDDNVNKFAGVLLKDIMDHREQWKLRNSPADVGVAADHLREFLKDYPDFKDFIDKSFAQYFEDAYRNESDTNKSNVANKVIQTLGAKAAPSFKPSPTFNLNSIPELRNSYIIIPSKMGDTWGPIFKSAIRSVFGSSAKVFFSPDQNSIYIYMLYGGIPLWSYSEITESETAYCSYKEATKHIDGGQGTPRCADFPPLFPEEVWNIAVNGGTVYSNPEELAYKEELSQLIDKAAECGILQFTPNDCNLMFPDSFDENSDIKKCWKDISQNCKNDNGYIDLKAVYPTFCKYFPPVAHQVRDLNDSIPYAKIMPDSIENVKLILRHQTLLTSQLRGFLSIYKTKIDDPVRNTIVIVEGARQETDFQKWLCLGLAFSEANAWYYQIGENKNLIINKMKVASSNNREIAALTKYMEYAACKEFFNSCNENGTTRKNLNKRAEKLMEKYGNEGYSDQLSQTLAAIRKRCEDVQDGFDDIAERRDDGMLTESEEKIRQFYAGLNNMADNF